MDPRPLAVVDIDGVVADVRHRLHFIEGTPRQWDRFFAAADEDPPLPEGVALVTKLAADGFPTRLADWQPRPAPLHDAQESDGRT